MKYTQKSFSVAMGGGPDFAANWDRIFGPKPHGVLHVYDVTSVFPDVVCLECGARPKGPTDIWTDLRGQWETPDGEHPRRRFVLNCREAGLAPNGER